MHYNVFQEFKTLKILNEVKLFFLFVCLIMFLYVFPLQAQSLQAGDPFTTYLRYLETEKTDSSLPSLNIRPFNYERFVNNYSYSDVHPWNNHTFFQNWKQLKEVSTTVEGVQKAQTHSVKHGDTLFSISNNYGVSVEDLKRWNSLTSNIISIGENLIVGSETVVSYDVIEKKVYPVLPESSVQYYTPVAFTTYNNNLPIGQNDGNMWQGRGVNSLFSAGVRISYKRLKASLRPEFIYNQNQSFELSEWPVPDGISEFGYEFSRIDYPQRFGDSSFTTLHPGNSWLRLEHNEFSAGVSTENVWAGPSLYNAIVLSNNAPGFMHAFIGTHKPWITQYGSFESKLFWGTLKESGYFDENPSNNRRYINGWVFNYSPQFFEGFHIGFSRVFVKPLENRNTNISDVFLFMKPFEKPGADGSLSQLQMQSLFARWKIPHYGFELYGEYSRNTAPESARDLLMQPEFSRGYTFGFFNRFEINPMHWLLLNFELTQLERPRSVQFRESEPYYRSLAVDQGYTHNGQILGAGIGPGSNSQKIKLEYYNRLGLAGISFNRLVYDNDRLYENYEIIGLEPWGIRNPRRINEVEFRYGLNLLVFLPFQLELQADLLRSKIFHFQHRPELDNPIPGLNIDKYNTNLQFTVRYNFKGSVR